MNLDKVLEEWKKESQAANDCICEILESYTEFLLFCITSNLDKNSSPEEILLKIKDMAAYRYPQWRQLYEDCKHIKFLE